jgi:hypothetical protein
MAIEVAKLKEMDYNTTITLGVIEQDADLKAIFTDDIKLPFNILYKLSEEGTLNDRTKELLAIIFEKLILTKKELINKYLQFANTKGVEINQTKELEIEVEQEEEIDNGEDSIVPVKPVVVTPKKTIVKKEKTGKELPRRYGRAKILEDIKRQDGVMNLHQRTGLNLNELKNIYVNLNSRLIKMLVAGEEIFTDEDCRTINSAITTLNNKLKKLIKK